MDQPEACIFFCPYFFSVGRSHNFMDTCYSLFRSLVNYEIKRIMRVKKEQAGDSQCKHNYHMHVSGDFAIENSRPAPNILLVVSHGVSVLTGVREPGLLGRSWGRAIYTHSALIDSLYRKACNDNASISRTHIAHWSRTSNSSNKLCKLQCR
jgi:hypothetical protein